MMNNKVNNDAQLQRMKALMNYGINESKQPAYSSVEYSKVAADGKLYGIVREGTNYFIKVAKNAKGGLVAENFDYINGFRNRNNNKFDSFASAQRFFGEKMIDINESVDNAQKRVIAEAWDINAKKEVSEEQTKKVQNEIARQRQIMENTVRIAEGKKQCCDMPGCDCPKEEKAEEVKKNPSAPFVNVPTGDVNANEKGNMKGAKKKPVKEATETPLSSRENPDYMDKSHGTKIGNAAPFCEPNGKVENAVADEDGGEAEKSHLTEGESMHDSDNQNTPDVGVGENCCTDPFDEKANVNESLNEFEDELDDDVESDELDDDVEDEDFDEDFDDDIDDGSLDGMDDEDTLDDVEGDDTDIEADMNADVDAELCADGDIAARMDSLETKLDSILRAINNMKYDDDEELYPEDDEMSDDEDDFDDSEDDFDNDEDVDIVESISYKNLRARKLNEESRLDDFGKHPAYQKKVMTLPANSNFMKDGQYDMNDSSVDGEAPYGQNKGDNSPFSQDVEQVEDAIVEAVVKMLKKKLG